VKPRVLKERAVVFTTMDGSFLGVGKKNQKEEEEEVPWVLWKGGLAIGSGTAYAMAIVASAFDNSDHSNYVLPLVP
jgi:hypothetical protein